MAALNIAIEPVRALAPVAIGQPADTPTQCPMSQQSAFRSHGYDMYPQEFVRLSGCQELKLRQDNKRGVLIR